MSNPKTGTVFGYPTIEAAREQWANIVDNDELVIYEVRNGLGPDTQPVSFVILRDLTLPAAGT